MPRPNDSPAIRDPSDILHRTSRPQGHSLLPRHRDWRYERGSFGHEDHQDVAKQRSVWDGLDYDARIGIFGRERRTVRGSFRKTDGGNGGVSEERDDRNNPTASPTTMGLDGTVESPEKVTPKASRNTSKIGNAGDGSARKLNLAKACSRPHTVAAFERSSENTDGGKEVWEQTRLITSLKCNSINIAAVERTSNEVPATPSRSIRSTPQATPSILKKKGWNSATATPTTPSALRVCDTIIEASPTPPLFERQWMDETHNFNMKTVVESLRRDIKPIEQLPAPYNWFPEAVPIDALFPPGVPMSAKEIHAFYPHHIRWRDVMIRLTNNDYRGADIIAIQSWFRSGDDAKPAMTGAQLNQILRDTLRRALPGYKTADGAYKGKPDCNLYTDHLRPGKFVEESRRGYVVPTFDDLLRGLRYVPAGLDARELTQSLVWYLNVKNLFTPPLELNVLHMQSLIRTIKQPLKAYGQRNLDKIAIEEWKRNGHFCEKEVTSETCEYERPVEQMQKLDKSKVEINVDEESVKLHLRLPVRHVLTFPFLAMVGMAAKGIEMGLAKAEERRAARASQRNKEGVNAGGFKTKKPFDESTEHAEQPRERPRGISPSYRIPKRKRSVAEDDAIRPREKRPIPTGPKISSAPRQPFAPRNFVPTSYSRRYS